ncbi:MAG: hypothetical protein AMJ42_03435 [Deltaproteobacteria bacterium DG_8]|nr:MAG: hypothetical protein AMJ42_03435 [Deltaproteobacteria bacterium DG_8]
MAIVEVSIVPLGLSTTSLSEQIALVLEPLNRSGLNYTLTAMGTIIEGDLEKVMNCVLKMHEIPFQKGIGRVYTTVKIDDRRDKPITIEGKVRSVVSKPC